MSETLEPPDPKRCQAEIPQPPFRMGGPPIQRCYEKPLWIAKEKRAPKGKRRRGSMSVCRGCRLQLEKQMPGYADFTPIRESRAAR